MTKGVTVDFNANIARFTGSVDKAINDLNRFQSNASRISGNISKTFGALGVGLSVAGFAGFVKSSINALDSLNDLSKSTSISVEQLSGLSLAAKQSGGDLESIAQSINKLTLNLGKNGDDLRKLGITAKDPLEAFKQLADILVAIKDPSERARVANDALGKSYAGSLPLLLEGSKAIGEMVANGQRLSGVTQKMADDADKFNDKMEELKLVSGAAGFQFAKILVPSLNDTATAMSNLAREGNALLALLRGFAGLGKIPFDLAFPIEDLKEATGATAKIKELKAELAELQQDKAGLQKTGGGLLNKLIYGGDSKEIDRKIEITKNQIAAFEKFGSKVDGSKPVIAGVTGTTPTSTSSGGSSKTPKVSELEKAMAALQRQSAELGKTGVELELFRLKSLGASEAQLRLAESMLTNIENFKSAKEVTDSVMNAQETYNATLDELNKLQAAGVISTETYERALSKAANTFAETDVATKAAIESAKKLNELLEQTPTGQLEKSREEMLFLGAAFDEGKISAEQFLEAVNVSLGRLPEQLDAVKSEMDIFAETAARNIQSAFADFLFDPFAKGLDDMLLGFAKMVQRMIAEAIAADIAKKLLGSMAGGTGDGVFGAVIKSIGGIFGGGKAIGGDVSPSQMYMVGEKGPELFVPRTAGTIVPNNKLSGGGMNVTNVFHVSGPADMRTQQQIAAAAYSGALRAARRNG